jgi:hypothetical protein
MNAEWKLVTSNFALNIRTLLKCNLHLLILKFLWAGLIINLLMLFVKASQVGIVGQFLF